MAKYYGSMPLDFIRESTTIAHMGIPVDLCEMQKARFGDKWTSFKGYDNPYMRPDIAKIAALAKRVASETKQPYRVLLLWSNYQRQFKTPRLFGLAQNDEKRALLIPTKILLCWPLMTREEETHPNGAYLGTTYYHYCLTSNGELAVVSQGGKFEWEPYRQGSNHGLYQGGSYIEVMKNDDIVLFDYQALWREEKKGIGYIYEGNRNALYDSSGNYSPDKKCLVNSPGEGITIMLERLLQGGNTSFRVEKNKATLSQIETYREKLKTQELSEGFAYTDEEISLLVQYETAKQALENAGRVSANEPNKSPDIRKEKAIAAFRKKFSDKYPDRPIPSDDEIEKLYYEGVINK